MNMIKGIDWEDSDWEYTEVPIRASMRVCEKVPAEWVDENGQFRPPIAVPEDTIFWTKWNFGFTDAGNGQKRKGIVCNARNWDDWNRGNGYNPNPYYPGPSLHPLPHLNPTYMRDHPEMEGVGDHYKDTVSMIANQLVSNLLSDPYGDWRIHWTAYFPVFAQAQRRRVIRQDIIGFRSFQMSMPNPLVGLWSQSQEPQAVEDESHWWFRFVKHFNLSIIHYLIYSDCSRLI